MSLSPTRLRRLTKHRRRLERMQEQAFAVTRQATAEREAALASAEQAYGAALGAGGAGGGAVDTAALTAASAHLVRTRKAIATKEAALRQSRIAEQEQLDLLLDRRRDRRATETLLERRLGEERERREQQDARRLDEAATRNWQRNREPSSRADRGGDHR